MLRPGGYAPRRWTRPTVPIHLTAGQRLSSTRPMSMLKPGGTGPRAPRRPLAGPVQGSFAVVRNEDGQPGVAEIPAGDSCGHGTACASIIRSIAPDCEIYSLQVLNRFTGSGDTFVTGLRWAVSQGFD